MSSLNTVRWQDLCNKRVLGYLSWRQRRRFIHRREVLDAMRQDLERMSPRWLLVMGDLVHISLPEEFREAGQWLNQLGEPSKVFVVPGNHETYVRRDWSQGLGQWTPYLAGDAEFAPGSFPVLRIRGQLAFIGLSSAIPTPPFMAYGRLGESQLQGLAEALRETAIKGLFRVVVLHHPPVDGVEKWRKRLVDAQAFRQLIAEYGAELICHGHCHRWIIESIPSSRGRTPVIGAPSSSSFSQDESRTGAYGLYELSRENDAWTLKLERRTYSHANSTFAVLDTRVFRIGSDEVDQPALAYSSKMP